MVTVVRYPQYPDVLILSGDAYNPADFVRGVREAINGLADAPENVVRRGTHDFWIVHAYPDLPGASFFTGGDGGASPLKLRGFINMSWLPDSVTAEETDRYLSTLAQEVGHCWLVPGDLKIKVDGISKPLAKDFELTQAINDDASFAALPLLARSNNHWSCYWQAHGSPMDGLCYQTLAEQDGHTAWRSSDVCFGSISIGGSAPLRVRKYCDLDLVLMGVLTPEQAYRGRPDGITWMQPRLTGDVESHAGLVVLFDRDDQLIFGFRQNHTVLELRNTRDQALGSSAVSPDYHPLGHPLNGMQLRVVRKGETYYFQAKNNNPAGGCLLAVLSALGLYGGQLQGVWDGVDQPKPIDDASDFSDWKTVAITRHSGDPLAVGVAVNKWKHPHLCDAAFYRFELKQGSQEWSIPTDTVPPVLEPIALDPGVIALALSEYVNVPSGALRRTQPRGAIFRASGGQLHVIAPYGWNPPTGPSEMFGDHAFHHGYDGTTFYDNSPKVLTRPPAGDFAFATHAKIHRTIITPWAGGYALDKTIWGQVSSTPASGVELTQAMKDKQDVPPNNAYRMAFIIATPDASLISAEMVGRLDVMRQRWMLHFAAATLGYRRADTAL